MGFFTLILVALWLLKSLWLTPGTRLGLSAGQLLSLDLLSLLLVIPAAYYTWKLFAVIRRRLLWKIRRRLILAHTLIGAIPVLLIVFIFYISALLLYYQFSYYLILNQIGIHTAQLHAFNYSLLSGLQPATDGTREGSTELRSFLTEDARYLLGTYPSAAIILHTADPASGSNLVLGAGAVNPDLLDNYVVPGWVEGGEFSGLILEDLQPALYAGSAGGAGDNGQGRLFLRSIVAGEYRPGAPMTVECSVPFDRHLLERLKAAIGQEMLLAKHVDVSSLNVMLQDTGILRSDVVSSTFDLGSEEAVGRPVWSILLYPISWAMGAETEQADGNMLFVELSTSTLVQNLFRAEGSVSQTIVGVLKIVVGFFLVVEIVSLLTGILLTKSITNAVHNLDRGTEFIRRGDFSHRVVVKSEDQLGALARSFNQMTEYVQSLVRERVQKERLERELEIAREVQEQLFPPKAPRLSGLEVSGLCLPARIVSGDYYDFLPLEGGRMGMALADICGKGISAALLMANLQATLRSNVFGFQGGRVEGGSNGGEDGSVSGLVKILNHQIHNYTSANKFASFFYAVYDDRSCSLTYCNAGHNPPLYFTERECRRLTEGGTVVGIFPEAEYQQETIRMGPGDMILAYTDGIVECVNEYGEEFGEARLEALVRRNRHLSAEDLQKAVVEQVLEWAFEEERDDDMTLIVAKFSR